jgi:hypothetical protein
MSGEDVLPFEHLAALDAGPLSPLVRCLDVSIDIRLASVHFVAARFSASNKILF